MLVRRALLLSLLAGCGASGGAADASDGADALAAADGAGAPDSAFADAPAVPADAALPDGAIPDAAGPDAAPVWPAPATDWVVTFGSSADDGVAGVAARPAGGVVAAGTAGAGTVDFGGGPLGPFAYPSLFVAAWDAGGGHLWAHRPTSLGNAEANGVVVDSAGTAYVCATFYNSMTIGALEITSAGNLDVAVFAVDAGGTPLWARTFGGTLNDFCHALALDEAHGRLLVTGAYMGTVDFGDGPLPVSGGDTDGYVAALTLAGDLVWSRGWLTTQPASNGGVTADSAGEVYVTGTFMGGVDFFGSSVTATDSQDAFVLALTSAGGFRWVRHASGPGAQLGQAAAAGVPEGVVVAAWFDGALTLGGTTLTTAGSYDLALLALDSAGAVAAATRFGAGAAESSASIAPFAGGWVVTGWFRGETSFGGPSLSSGFTEDVFVLSVDAAASAHRWSAGLGTMTGSEIAASIVAAGATALYAGGSFAGPSDLGAGPIAPAGGRDAFVVRLAAP